MTKRNMQQGETYGHLTVVDPYTAKSEIARCICKCGAETEVKRVNLRTGNTSSCGCIKAIASRVRLLTHGDTGSVEHGVWNGIRSRCFDESLPGYADYGAKGVTVCDRWLGKEGYKNFLSDMGRRPSSKHSIDRIDCRGNYEPSNCRWSTTKEQSRNRRNNRRIKFNGEEKTLIEWSEIIGPSIGVGYAAIQARLKRGWSVEDALSRVDMRQTNFS